MYTHTSMHPYLVDRGIGEEGLAHVDRLHALLRVRPDGAPLRLWWFRRVGRMRGLSFTHTIKKQQQHTPNSITSHIPTQTPRTLKSSR